MQGTQYGPVTQTDGPNDIDTEKFLYFKKVLLGTSFGQYRGKSIFGIERKTLRETNEEFRTHFNCEANDKNNSFTEEERSFRDKVDDKFYDLRDALAEIAKKGLKPNEHFNVKEACDTCLEIIEQKKQEYNGILSAKNSDIATLSEAKIMHPALIEVETILELYRDLAAQNDYLTANDLWMLENVPTEKLSVEAIETLWEQSDECGIITRDAASEFANG